MAKSKRGRYEQNRQNIEDRVEDGSMTPGDREYIFEFLDAKDPECGLVNDPDDSGKADGTLATYTYSLRRVATMSDVPLTDATAEDLNTLLDDMRHGRVDGVKDDGLTKGTAANYQKALRKFYEYHDDLGIEKEDIILYTPENSAVDERDIFDKEDIQALRDAATHPRDRAMIDMLLYTGQRRSAILNLRIKDIDIEEGVFYLNEDAGDLKGANGKRPLLYAEKAVREWLRSHPCNDDPDAYFITQKSPNMGSHDYEMGSRIDGSTIHVKLKKIGEEAGVDKPVNAHNFRHTFVTICKRNYGMDNDTIKRLIGHDMSSTVMETTYAHLTDDDVINAAERATGIRDDEPESPMTPDICDNCDEPVPLDDAKACPSCGITFRPDAYHAKETLKERGREEKEQAETLEEYKDADAIAQALDDDPHLATQLMDKLGEMADGD